MRELGMILNVAVIVCYVVDVSGFTDTWKGWLQDWLHLSSIRDDIKPFTCSLCMTWWCSLVALLCTGHLTLFNIMLAAMVSMCADLITESIHLFKAAIRAIIARLWCLTDKLQGNGN